MNGVGNVVCVTWCIDGIVVGGGWCLRRQQMILGVAGDGKGEVGAWSA